MTNVTTPEQKKKPKPPKRMAVVDDPSLEAIVEGLFRFEHESQAVSLMQRVAEQFVISREQDKIDPNITPTLKMWIRGYGITPEDTKNGYRGNFAKISVKKLPGPKFTLIAEKMDVPLKLHPMKERPKHRHPNMGHPLLRAAERGKPYPSAEVLRAELLKLHEEYPETTIPGRDKLHMMIYSRQMNPPIRKLSIRIAANADGTFKLEIYDGQKKREELAAAMPSVQPMDGSPKAEAPDGGKFTSMVALQRKKKPVSKRKPVKPASGEE